MDQQQYHFQNAQAMEAMLVQLTQQVQQLTAERQGQQRDQNQLLKFIRPETFDGSSSSSVDAWVFQLEQYFTACGCQEDAAKILLASTLLRGHASAWWRLCHQEATTNQERAILTWENFKNRIQAQFRRIDPQRVARQQLANLTQESQIQDYTFKFRTLMLEIGLSMNEIDKVYYFKRGLKRHIRRELEIRDPQTLEDAIKMAERIDAVDEELKNNPGNRVAMTSSNVGGGNGPIPMDIDQIEEDPDREEKVNYLRLDGDQRRMGSRFSQRGGARINYSVMRCFECGGRGHPARVCPNRRMKNREEVKPRNERRQGFQERP
jgi:hypothetical protein